MNSIEAVAAAPSPLNRRGADADAWGAAAAAVLAHTLLNSIAVVRGGTELLARHHDDLPEPERRLWYRRIDDHADFLASVLERVAQGRLAEALAVAEQGGPRTTR